jgi:hypothetical protein
MLISEIIGLDGLNKRKLNHQNGLNVKKFNALEQPLPNMSTIQHKTLVTTLISTLRQLNLNSRG